MPTDIITCVFFSCDWFYKHPDLKVRMDEEKKHWDAYHSQEQEEEEND